MRDKTDTPLPETTQAPPIFEIFDPREWVQLTPAFGQLKSIVGARGQFIVGAQDLTLTCFNRYIHDGLLELGLASRNNGTIRWFNVSECQKLTVYAPHNFEEGCRITPYHEGVWYVRRSGLDKLTTIPVTPTASADRQLHAEGRPEPAARAEEAMPEPIPEPPPSSPQVEPVPPPELEPVRRGRPPDYDWDEGFQFMRRKLDELGDPKSPIDAVKGWRSYADVARAVAAHIAIGDQQPDPKHTVRVIRPKLEKWRAEQAERNSQAERN